MMKRLTSITAASMLVACGHARGDDATLTVDPMQSSVSADITIEIFIFSSSDSDSSPLSGAIDVTVNFDTGGNAVSLEIRDFSLIVDDSLNYNFSLGASISADFDPGVTVSYATPGTPSGPFPISQMAATFGEFSATGVTSSLAGMGSVTGSFLGSPINEVIDLSTAAPTPVDFDGVVEVVGDQVTVTATVDFTSSSPFVAGGITGTQTIVGSGTAVASGMLIPDPSGCNPADLNDAAAPNPAAPTFGMPDGIISPTDFSAFAFYFSTGDLAADINDASAASPAFPNFGVPDGILTPTDFSAFAAYFGAGCPCTLPGCP